MYFNYSKIFISFVDYRKYFNVLICSMVLLSSGCVPVKWTTSDGKTIKIEQDRFKDKSYCEDKHNLSNNYPWRNSCRQFGILLQETDPVNSMKYLKMACDEGTGCMEISKSAEIANSRNLLTKELIDIYINPYLLHKCRVGYIDNCWGGCDGQGEDQTQFLCIDISNLAQKLKDTELELLAHAYNCANTGLNLACENNANKVTSPPKTKPLQPK